jgi:hypothetical protein
MAKAVMIASLTWSLMRASEIWLNDSIFTEAALFVALTVLVLIVLNPNLAWSARDDD